MPASSRQTDRDARRLLYDLLFAACILRSIGNMNLSAIALLRVPRVRANLSAILLRRSGDDDTTNISFHEPLYSLPVCSRKFSTAVESLLNSRVERQTEI